MTNKEAKIIYTKIDEAPALATYSLLPVVSAFLKSADIDTQKVDISLAGRILANFPEKLTNEQKTEDGLSFLGKLVEKPEANIIKLPNISASVSQLKAAIKELKSKGFDVPDYPEEAKSEAEQKIKDRYSVVLGSAVNPVLRQGNSDRRVAPSVKENAQKNPHKMMKEWPADSKTHVAHMSDKDFYSTERSAVIEKDQNVSVVFTDKQGKKSVLKEKLHLLKDEVLDGSFMSRKALREFIEQELQDAKQKDVLFSVHLKATMMKVSDPEIFGHFVSVYFKNVFEKHKDFFKAQGINPNLGLGDLYAAMENFPEEKRKEIEADIQEAYENRPDLAMVNSDKGITNLHAGNDIIIDASMPVVIRDGGRMWNPSNELQDTKAVIPDTSYSEFYQTAIDFCKKHGAFNPATMGNVSNVGLMAQKAEEYGSHDKTFIASKEGTISIIDEDGKTLISHEVEEGDIWRACQTKDIAVRDWVKLAVKRAKETGVTTIFWLDENRAHDAQLIKKVNTYIKAYDTKGLDIQILPPVKAMQLTLERTKAGKDTVSVTGNVLRDYLTDLFPILELGTSAKMLSIIPLLEGGGLFETGAGGSAPKHVQQFLEEGHLRWDSLGEFLALTVSLEHLAKTYDNAKAAVLAKTLDKAVSTYLENGNSPSRKAGEPDNRASHYYLATYWAKALAEQNDDQELRDKFAPIAEKLEENERKILKEIAAVEGKPKDIGGYFKPDDTKAEASMRPSATFNEIIAAL